MDIVAGTNTDTYWPIKKPKKSGLMGTGVLVLPLAAAKTPMPYVKKGTQSQSFSTVGSTGGSVAISAGNQLHLRQHDRLRLHRRLPRQDEEPL